MMATLRAFITNVKNIGTGKRLIGASTITQQVAKNFLYHQKCHMKEKLKLFWQYVLKEHFQKEILELYLNEIYLGFKSYGVAAAA